MLILVFSVGLRVLPVQGTGSWRHFVLPVATLAGAERADRSIDALKHD